MKIDIPNKKKIILGILCAVCCLSVAVMIFTIISTLKKRETFTPPALDLAAITGTPEVPENLGYSPLEVEQFFKAYVCGKLTANGSYVDVYFTSPETNAVWLLLRVTDEKGKILGETGIIRPGEYVKTLKLKTVPDKEANVKLNIIAYQPETYTSMGTVGLNTELKMNEKGSK